MITAHRKIHLQYSYIKAYYVMYIHQWDKQKTKLKILTRKLV